MSIKLEELLNLHADKNCHVVGHGPSLQPYLDDLSKINKDKDILFSINDVDKFTNLIPDYWLTTNPDYSVPNIYQRINKFKDTTFIYSDVVDETPYDTVKSLLNVKYYSFDNFHFKSQPNIFFVKGWRLGCKRGWLNCCDHIIDGRLTIQEYLQKVSGYKYHYSTCDTNILHAIAFSIILGCKNIYLYGIDLNYKIGYVNGYLTGPDGATHGDTFDHWMDRLQSDFYIINESAKMMGIKIHYLGFNDYLKKIFIDGISPNKVYESECKNYD